MKFIDNLLRVLLILLTGAVTLVALCYGTELLARILPFEGCYILFGLASPLVFLSMAYVKTFVIDKIPRPEED